MRPSTDLTRPRRVVNGMSPAGLSLVELLVALTVAILVLAAAIAVTFANRRVMNMDQARTSLNQNLRTGLSIIGDDVQISGERLTAKSDAYLPPVEVQGGTVLVLRRNLLDVVLPVCKDIKAGSNADAIFVALKKNNSGNPNCTIDAYTKDPNWPDNLGAWRLYRLDNNGTVPAFIVDPITKVNEFFTYDAEDSSNFHIHRASGKWAGDYAAADRPQVYVLQERRYQMLNGYLEFVLNGDTAAGQKLIPDVTDFQVRAVLDNGDVRTDFPQAGDDFASLKYIEVTLDGTGTQGRKSIDRQLSARFFPRNVLSQ